MAVATYAEATSDAAVTNDRYIFRTRIAHGVNGFLCRTEDEYMEAIKNVDKLTPLKGYEENIKARFAIETVVKNYIPLYEEVANGLRWK